MSSEVNDECDERPTAELPLTFVPVCLTPVQKERPPALNGEKLARYMSNWSLYMCLTHHRAISPDPSLMRSIKERYYQVKSQFGTCLCCGHPFQDGPSRSLGPTFWGCRVNDHFHCCHPGWWSV
jgi:hypothetical protein